MRIQVISPMWPSPESKHTGVFVKNLSDALVGLGFEVDNSAVLHGKGQGFVGRLQKHAGLGKSILEQATRRADCVYVHAPTWFSPLVELSRLARGKKLVVHTHGGEVYPHSRMERLAQPMVGWLCRRADLVIAPSHYYAREVRRAFGVPEDRMFVSPSGGVDTTRFHPSDRLAARQKLGLDPNAIVLGFVGRIEDDKGWDVFLDVVHHFSQQGRKVEALVVGDGGDHTRLVERARDLGILDRVHRTGMIAQSELPEAYAAMDVFLFPTRRGAEALGLVPIEAMACGVPAVGSNGYAVPEYIIEGQTGWLAPERDVAAFVHGVERIVDQSEDARAEMSRRAAEGAKRYDTTKITQILAERLRVLLA